MKKFTFLITLLAFVFTNAQVYNQNYESFATGTAAPEAGNQVQGGTASVQIASASGNTTKILKGVHTVNDMFIRSANFPVLEGEVYNVTVDVATSNGVHIVTMRQEVSPFTQISADIAATSTNGSWVSGNLGRIVQNSNEFGTTSATFTIPAGITSARVQIYNFGVANTYEIDNFVVTKKNFTTSGSGTNWNDPNTWSGGTVPPSTNPVVIDHPVIVNTDSSSGDVTLNSTLTLEKGHSLTVNGDLTNNGIASDVLINNDSNEFSSLIVGGIVTGDVRHRRYINANPENDLIAPAVLLPFNDFYTEIGTRIHTYGDGGIAFGPFDSSTGTYTQFTPSTTTTITQGTGYIAGASGNPDQNFNFDGSVRTDQIDVPISGAGASPWNLIGNPYPSYVAFNAFYAQLVNDGILEPGFVAIYGYDAIDTDGSKWTVWDSANGNLIAPGQGFFVRSAAAGGDVTFTPAMRTTGTSDDFITGRIASNSVKAVLTLAKNSMIYKTNLYFTEGKTRGLDYGGDTAAFSGPGSSAINLFTNLVEDNNGLELYNQALAYDDFNDVIVPLGLVANIGEQITLSLNDAETTIPSNINVYLEDNLANTWTLLNTGDYTLTPTLELSVTGRFFVHFTTSTLSTDDNILSGLQIYLDQPSRVVRVKGQLAADTKAVIYDIQGRQVLEQVLSNDTIDNSIQVNSLNTGIYLVQLNNRTQNRTQKVIIR